MLALKTSRAKIKLGRCGDEKACGLGFLRQSAAPARGWTYKKGRCTACHGEEVLIVPAQLDPAKERRRQ